MGNFVVPSDGKDDTWDGTIAMAGRLFLEKFLLPRLSFLGLRLQWYGIDGHAASYTYSIGSSTMATITITVVGGSWTASCRQGSPSPSTAFSRPTGQQRPTAGTPTSRRSTQPS